MTLWDHRPPWCLQEVLWEGLPSGLEIQVRGLNSPWKRAVASAREVLPELYGALADLAAPNFVTRQLVTAHLLAYLDFCQVM